MAKRKLYHAIPAVLPRARGLIERYPWMEALMGPRLVDVNVVVALGK
jgi:hypothetical protein